MSSSIFIPMTSASHTHTTILKPNQNHLLFGQSPLPKRLSLANRRVSLTPIRASLSAAKESVLKDFHERRALKIISGLQNFDRENVASVVTAAYMVCVSSVDPEAFPAAVKAGALMVEIGNYDS